MIGTSGSPADEGRCSRFSPRRSVLYRRSYRVLLVSLRNVGGYAPTLRCRPPDLTVVSKYDVKYFGRPALFIYPFHTVAATTFQGDCCKASCPPSRRIPPEDSGVAYSLLRSQAPLLLSLFISESVLFRPIYRSNLGSAQISAWVQNFRETCHHVQVASSFLALIDWSERNL